MPGGLLVFRLLLLVLTAVGVAGMHTLGHANPSGDHHGPLAAELTGMRVVASTATHHAATAVERSAAMAAEAFAATAQESVAAVVARRGAGQPGRSGGLDPWSVCLAVLAAGLVLLVAVLCGRGGRGWAARGRTRRMFGHAGRGPPFVPLIGLHLADLSVLRN
ncbi:MAG TPA: hypothetical protein VF163_01660 [Micromonosporaceae bacterium]